MTECSTELTLLPLSRKPVTVRNDGGALTSDAGVLLLREIDERLGLTRRLAAHVLFSASERGTPALKRKEAPHKAARLLLTW